MKAICNSFLVSFFKKAMLRLLILTGLLLLLSLTARGQTVSASEAREVIAATLILEAGGETDPRAMSAVREVIANRAKNKTEISVCLAPKQFSCWNGKTTAEGIAKAKKHPKWAQALSLVNEKTNYTSGATHYHTLKVSPSWKNKLAKTATIGNHIFYK